MERDGIRFLRQRRVVHDMTAYANSSTNRAAAQQLMERALAVATEVGYDRMRIRALGSVAMISYGKGDLTASRQQAETALALARDFGEKKTGCTRSVRSWGSRRS